MKFDELGLLGLIVNMGLRSFIHRLTAPAYSTGEGPAGPMKLACVVNQELKMGRERLQPRLATPRQGNTGFREIQSSCSRSISVQRTEENLFESANLAGP